MRIIAGSKRGMKLLMPKTPVSRPIIDRVKESVFDVLYKYDLPEGRIVADVFAGVGSLGLEALSRGARFVTFVENDRKVASILDRNIEKCDFAANSRVVKGNAFKIGAPVGLDGEKYDLVFVDPPYAMSRAMSENSPLGELLALLCEQVESDGIVVVRTERYVELLDEYGQLGIIDRREWGTMAVTILQLVRR
jgi:16S rRNA (guanine(966)-N(2))-methyltransferase RsmD